MTDKKELRKIYKSIRSGIMPQDKADFDRRIFESFVNSCYYHSFDMFLCYVSIGSEVDTSKIIKHLLFSGKKVSVPFCHDGVMDFYEINSFDDLFSGMFGIPTVNCSKHKKITDFSKALCIVPALSYDTDGNRLGYGGGYYDRFLADKKIPTLGLCYEGCICQRLPSEKLDIKVGAILTEKCLRISKTKEDSTYE